MHLFCPRKTCCRLRCCDEDEDEDEYEDEDDDDDNDDDDDDNVFFEGFLCEV